MITIFHSVLVYFVILNMLDHTSKIHYARPHEYKYSRMIPAQSVFIVSVAFFFTCCGNTVLYAESSKLGKLASEILKDLQLIVRSYI